jgi:YD repeat-containing protein
MQRVSMERSSGAERRTTYDRAADGRLVARRVEQRQGASWRPMQRTTHGYRDGALVAQRRETWSDGAWTPDQRITLERGEDGAVRTVVQQTRRGGQWVNEARLTLQPSDYSTDSLDATDVQRRLIRATWARGAWDRTTRITFTVAEGGGLITQHNETWTGTQWANSTRLTYMYDGAGYPIEKSLAVWIGDGWTDGPLHFYDYQVHGEQVEQRTETWMGTRRLRTTQATLTYAKPVQVPLLGTASFN